MKMPPHYSHNLMSLLIFSFLLSTFLLPQSHAAQTNQTSCNFFQGKWVYDPSRKTYTSCPLIDSEFDCLQNGRRDSRFLKYTWQPDKCTLPSFDAEAFLQQWKGKKIMFVGDSLSLNMWESLCCIIMAALPTAKTTVGGEDSVHFVNFDGYKVSLLVYRSPYLVDVEREENGNVLKLNSIKGGVVWENMDVLIFNSWHWWLHKGQSRQWDYITDGNGLYKDMNRLEAFYKGMTTWANWVDQTVDTSKTKVFFQGISPTHYQGAEWREPHDNCKQKFVPLSGSSYPGGLPAAALVVGKVLASMSTRVYLLNITALSQLRVDGHPSTFTTDDGYDCSHWCLPGVPDTWNQILYAILHQD